MPSWCLFRLFSAEAALVISSPEMTLSLVSPSAKIRGVRSRSSSHNAAEAFSSSAACLPGVPGCACAPMAARTRMGLTCVRGLLSGGSICGSNVVRMLQPCQLWDGAELSLRYIRSVAGYAELAADLSQFLAVQRIAG